MKSTDYRRAEGNSVNSVSNFVELPEGMLADATQRLHEYPCLRLQGVCVKCSRILVRNKENLKESPIGGYASSAFTPGISLSTKGGIQFMSNVLDWSHRWAAGPSTPPLNLSKTFARTCVDSCRALEKFGS